MAGERAKNIKTGSLKKFNILQCNMQFEKLLFLVKFFAVTKKFLFTKVFKRRGNNPSLEVWMGGNNFSAAADMDLQSMWNNSFS